MTTTYRGVSNSDTESIHDGRLSLPPLGESEMTADAFSRLGLPSNEALDDNMMGTSTAPSDELPLSQPAYEMRGFLFTDFSNHNDDENAENMPSSPPGVMKTVPELYDNKRSSRLHRLSSAPGQFLDNMLPSSMGNGEESDSQRTRLVWHSSRDVSTAPYEKRSIPIESVAPDSAKGNETPPPAWPDARDDNRQDSHIFGDVDLRDTLSPSQEISLAITKKSHPSAADRVGPVPMIINPPYMNKKLPTAKLKGKQKKTHEEVSYLPLSITNKRASPTDQKSLKRPRKQPPERKIPPLPDLCNRNDIPQAEKPFDLSVEPYKVYGHQEFRNGQPEVSQPGMRSISRRRSSFKVAENGSPLVTYLSTTGSSADDAKSDEVLEPSNSPGLEPSPQTPPVRRSARIKKITSKITSEITDMTIQQQPPPRKTTKSPKKLMKSIPSQSNRLPRHNEINNGDKPMSSEPPLPLPLPPPPPPPLRLAPTVTSQASQPKADAELGPHTIKQQSPRKQQLLEDDVHNKDIFGIRPPKPPSSEAFQHVAAELAQSEDSLALRNKITEQIARREARKQIETQTNAPVPPSVPEPTQLQMTPPPQASPIQLAVQQATSGVMDFVDKQQATITAVVDEYRIRTADLVKRTQELHLQEADEVRIKLEKNHHAFMSMCDQALARIERLREDAMHRQQNQANQMRTQVSSLENILQSALEGLLRLHGSMGSELETIDKMSFEEIKMELAKVVDGSGSIRQMKKAKAAKRR